MNDSPDETRRPAARRRYCFSLLALLLFVALVCVLLAWLVQPQTYVVEAMFQVSSQPEVLLDESRRFDEREWDIVCATQIALIKSDFVLQAALRRPKVASLPLVAAQEDAVAWLADQLEVEFVSNSEVLAIRMRGTESQTPDLRVLVDAVSRAYQEEVVFAEDQRRQTVRDAKAKLAGRLRDEIEEKMEARQIAAAAVDDDGIDATVFELEIRALTDIWRNLIRSVEYDDVEAAAPPRVRLLQPAMVRPE